MKATKRVKVDGSILAKPDLGGDIIAVVVFCCVV
jgi:hypothetical protein